MNDLIEKTFEETFEEVYEPLGDNVLIELLPDIDKTHGGIILPDNAKEKPQRGKIIAVGPGRMRPEGYRTPMSVKKGDLVLHGRYAGNLIKTIREEGKPDRELFIMSERDLLARLEEDDNTSTSSKQDEEAKKQSALAKAVEKRFSGCGEKKKRWM